MPGLVTNAHKSYCTQTHGALWYSDTLKGTILQRNYRKMTMSFSYNSFVKFQGYRFGATAGLCYIQICVITRHVKNGTAL